MFGSREERFKKNMIAQKELTQLTAIDPSLIGPGSTSQMGPQNSESSNTGILIINADDWGRDQETTDRIVDCFAFRAVSSVSAMVFMEDSERAAELARERCVDTGLHMNFTAAFSASYLPVRVKEHHREVSAYLSRRRLNQVIFHPGLARSFEYVVAAQLEEYCRLYGAQPERVDGHHHMHLCANVLLAGLLPAGTIVRRNFSFQPGEKGALNRLYREAIDRKLARRHRLTDFFFSLSPLEPQSRLERILAVSRQSTVEVETHPANTDEYCFLTGGEAVRWTENLLIAPRFDIPRQRPTKTGPDSRNL